jgi:hypothetical protein
MMKSSSNSSTFSASKRKTGSSRGNDMGDAKDDDGFKADREVKTICNMVSGRFMLLFHCVHCICWCFYN